MVMSASLKRRLPKVLSKQPSNASTPG
jgi:hypothetical protein